MAKLLPAVFCCLLLLLIHASIFPCTLLRDRSLTWGSGMNCQDTESQTTKQSTEHHGTQVLLRAVIPALRITHTTPQSISPTRPGCTSAAPRAGDRTPLWPAKLQGTAGLLHSVIPPPGLYLLPTVALFLQSNRPNSSTNTSAFQSQYHEESKDENS